MTCHTLDAAELAAWRADATPSGSHVGVVAGTFDLLHPANLAALDKASSQCDKLCVMLPLTAPPAKTWHSLPDRAQFLSYISSVNITTAFSPEHAANFLEGLRPFTFFSCPECDNDSQEEVIRQAADKNEALPFLPGLSTPDIVEAIRGHRTPIAVPAFDTPDTPAASSGVTVSVNGCFDLLHLGHFRFLTDARAMGNELVVLLNDDASVTTYKGPDRPVFPADFRTRALCALSSVSRVQLFSEDEPLKTLAELRPDVHVKGGSFDEARAGRERELLESWGGKLEFCPLTEGHSTTGLVERMLLD